MISSSEVFQELSELNNKIHTLLYHTKGSNEFSEVDENISYGGSPDERMYQDEFFSILKKLEEVENGIKYLSLPIKKTGILHKNSHGRYESDFIEYTSGYGIEILLHDGEAEKWVVSRIEHNGKDYYVVGYPSVELEGLQVRIRE